MRPLGTVCAVALLAVGLAGCSSGGGISLPTNLPTTIPSVTLPSITITLPTVPVTTPTSTSPRNTTNPASTSRTEDTGTVTVTRTSTPTTTTVTSTVTPAPQPAAATTGIPPWLWILLAILVLALLALVIWLSRRARVRREWDDRFAVARRNALWVEDALVQQVMARGSTAEAAATWQSARPRLLSLDEELYTLGANAPDPERAGHATTLRGRLAALVDAMGADTALGPDATADDMRTRRAAVWRARTELRTWLDAADAHR